MSAGGGSYPLPVLLVFICIFQLPEDGLQEVKHGEDEEKKYG